MLDELIARVEQGTAEDQGRLLEEAWEAAVKHSAEFRCFATAPCSGFGNNAGKFAAALEARAYESAAMMLVPRGWTHEHSGQWRTNKKNRWKWRHRLGSPERSHKGWPKRVAEVFEAHSPALALTPAALKAMKEDGR